MKSILLKASAGSGKTTRLTEEVFNRILIGGKFIVALTFTRAATTEMRSRIMKEIAAKKGAATVGALAADYGGGTRRLFNDRFFFL